MRQRGAVAIWVALMLVALMTAMFLAIEAGRLYFGQRDLQRLASLAAAAGTQIASGCAGPNADGSGGSLDQVTQLVIQALISNGGDASLLTGVNGFPPVELGRVYPDPINTLRVFQPLPEGDTRINAVRVNLSRPSPTPFTAFITQGGPLKASASAEQPINGSLSVGSTLAGLHGGLLNETIGGLLCPTSDFKCQDDLIGLDVASYASGLANVGVSLGDLATAAGVSVKDLSDPLALSTQSVILPDFIDALASGLSGRVSGTVTSLLGNLAAAASGNRTEIPLGQLLGAVDDVAGAVPFVNLLDLIAGLGAASKADPDNPDAVVPIKLPVGIDIPGVATVKAYLQVLEGQQQSGAGRPGSTQAQSAQVRVRLRVSVAEGLLNTVKNTINAVTSLISALISVSIDKLNLNIGIDVGVSRSTAFLDAVQCPNPEVNLGQPIASLSATPSIADVTIGTFTGTPTDTVPRELETTADAMTLIKVSVSSALLGSTTVSVPMATSVVGVGGSPGRVDLRDVTEFEAGKSEKPGLPLVYNALGGPGTDPVTPVAANPQTVGSPVGLQASIAVSVDPGSGGTGLLGAATTIVAGVVNGVINTVLPPVINLVNSLAARLINPLLESLGVQLGGATVTMNAVQVGRPVKVSTCLPGAVGPQACLIAP